MASSERLTDRASAEEFLRHFDQAVPYVREMIGRSPLAALLHVEGQVVFANRAAAQLLGAETPEALLGVSFDSLAPSGATFWQPGKHTVHPVRRLDGKPAELEISSTLVSVLIDEREVVVSVAQDVTGRREAEDAESRFQALFEGVPDAVVVADEGRIVMASAAASELTGYSRAELVGIQVDQLVPTSLQLLARPSLETLPRKRSPVPTPLYVKTKSGEPVPVELTLGPARFAGRPVAIVTLRDISERLRAEEALRQAVKLDAIGRLAGGVAHDFNNILSVVLSLTGMLQEMGLPVGAADLVKEIEVAGERAGALTRQLLALARRQPSVPKPMSVNDEIRTFVGFIGRTLGEDVRQHVELAEQPLVVRLDPTHLQQVLLNLAVNARDAMPGGGDLWIRTSRSVAGEVIIDVTDTGMGMDAETLAHAFEPFFTTKADGKGTGLGLATVYGIVKQGGGELTVRSKVGEGTTFTVAFPPCAEPVQPKANGSQPHVGGQGKVFVVEDDEILRSVIHRVLTFAGYQVFSAGGLEDALASARRNGPIDVLITDVVMPGTDGLKLATELKLAQPKLPVIFVSGYAQDVVALASTGRLLAKPFTANQLLAAVREALAPPEAG